MTLLLFWSEASGQESKDYLVVAQRNGTVEFRDSLTLDVLSRVDVILPSSSTGINGVFVDPNGRTLYIEGPEHIQDSQSNGCCSLYSLGVPDLKASIVAGIWGSASRRPFVTVGSSLLTRVSGVALSPSQLESDHWQISPDGHWWAGFRSGPVVDIYDANSRSIVRSWTDADGSESWFLSGTWMNHAFYVVTTHDNSAWLWRVPAENGSARPVATPLALPLQACGEVITGISSAGDQLLVYEQFGGNFDRRESCPGTQGGAWLVDPESKQSLRQVASQLYFWRLIPSRDGKTLFGVTSTAAVSGAPSQLVLLDSISGSIRAIRPLESDYSFIAFATLHSLPKSNQLINLPLR